jgi:protein SCO1
MRPVFVGLAIALLSACTPSSQTPRQYQLEGQILAVRPEDDQVLIKHGDIEGFMPGMTMPFKVRDARLLADRAPGDLVKAQLMVTDTDAWLAALDKTGSAPLTEAATMPPAAFITPLEAGDAVPDTALIGQDETSLSLADWRGSAVAITFIYVRCPLPQFCPLLDRRFADVQRAIAADDTLRGRARLLSVSFDPDADTPARLRAHAARLKADEQIWQFATAPRDVVDRFAAQLGVYGDRSGRPRRQRA